MFVKFKTTRNRRGYDYGDLIKFVRLTEGYGGVGFKVKTKTYTENVRYADLIAICPKVGYQLPPNVEWNIPYFMAFIPDYKFRQTAKGVKQAQIPRRR